MAINFRKFSCLTDNTPGPNPGITLPPGAAEISFNQTAFWDYEALTPAGTLAPPIDTTQTVTWVLDSTLPIVTGEFLDGSKWVVNNGDIRLLRVTPEASQGVCQTLLANKDWNFLAASDGNTKPEQGDTVNFKFWKNITVINPDIGKMRIFDLLPNVPGTRWSQWHINSTAIPTPSGTISAALKDFQHSRRTRSNSTTPLTEIEILFPIPLPTDSYSKIRTADGINFTSIPLTLVIPHGVNGVEDSAVFRTNLTLNPFDGRGGRQRASAGNPAGGTGTPSINGTTGATVNMGTHDLNTKLLPYNSVATPTVPGGPRIRGHFENPGHRIGTTFDVSQKWASPGPLGTSLKSGDMVVTAVSHHQPAVWKNVGGPAGAPATSKWEDQSIHGTTTITIAKSTGSDLGGVGGNSSLIEFFAILTIIDPSDYNRVSQNKSFRPPLNWDPADRANAPIMEEDHRPDQYEYSDDDLKHFAHELPIKNNSVFPSQGASGETLSNIHYEQTNFPTRYKNAFDWHTVGGAKFLQHQSPTPNSGDTRSRDAGNTEYGTGNLKLFETQALLCFNTTNADGFGTAQREKLRRALTQRGIDEYGAARSLGVTVHNDGGHCGDTHCLMMFAYMMTRNVDIGVILDMNSLGNVNNNTLMPITGPKAIAYHENGNYASFGQSWTSRDLDTYLHIAKFQNLEILKIETGNDLSTLPRSRNSAVVANGPYQKITVYAPYNVDSGKVYNVLGLTGKSDSKKVSFAATAFGNQLGRTTIDTLHTIAGGDTSRSGRWNWEDNVNQLDHDSHAGGYIRNPNNGKISRIITSRCTEVFHKVWNSGTILNVGPVDQVAPNRETASAGDLLTISFPWGSNSILQATTTANIGLVKNGDVVYNDNMFFPAGTEFTTIVLDSNNPVLTQVNIAGNIKFATWKVSRSHQIPTPTVPPPGISMVAGSMRILQGIKGFVTDGVLTVTSNSESVEPGSMLYWENVLPGTCVTETLTANTFTLNKSQSIGSITDQKIIAVFRITELMPKATIDNTSLTQDGPSSANSALVFYLRDNIFPTNFVSGSPDVKFPKDTDTSHRLCDLAPHTVEDVLSGKARVGSINRGQQTMNYPFSNFPYTYVFGGGIALYSMIFRGCQKTGLRIPRMIDLMHKKSLFYTDTLLGRAFYNRSAASTYFYTLGTGGSGNNYLDPYHSALLRRFVLDGAIGPLIPYRGGPVINLAGVTTSRPLYSANRSLHDPADIETSVGGPARTWIEFGGVTGVSVVALDGGLNATSSTDLSAWSIFGSNKSTITGAPANASDEVAGQFAPDKNGIQANPGFDQKGHPSWAGFDIHNIPITIEASKAHSTVFKVTIPYFLGAGTPSSPNEQPNNSAMRSRNPLSYEDYFLGKSLFVWPQGRLNPIEMVRVDDDHWTQWGYVDGGTPTTRYGTAGSIPASSDMPPWKGTVSATPEGDPTDIIIPYANTSALGPHVPWIKEQVSINTGNTRLSLTSVWTQVWAFPNDKKILKDFIYPWVIENKTPRMFWADPIANGGVLPALPVGAAGVAATIGSNHP